MRISAIIPTFNNGRTIQHVLQTVQKIQGISEIIVVDDGSRDQTSTILRSSKGIVRITHKKNLGKGAALVSGWNRARNDIILGVDADLRGLTKSHIQNLLLEYKTGHWDTVIAARESPSIFDWLSGERIYKKSALLPFKELVNSSGNGVEQIINFAHRNKRTKIIYSKHIRHVQRYQRGGMLRAIPLYVQEGWQLARTEFLLRTML